MYILDRLEGEIAVIEADDAMIEAPRNTLPSDVREGDVLQKDGDRYRIDRDATERRKAEIDRLMKDIWG